MFAKNLKKATSNNGFFLKMEEQVDAKRARTIGVSNFGVHQIDRLVKNARIKPANTQVELNVYYQQKELTEYCKKNNIVVVSYASLGSPGTPEFLKKMGRGELKFANILGDPVVTKIAQKHNRTAGQVLLRYLTQKDIVVIPKSVKPERVKENFNILDFTLDADDLKALESLDKGFEGRMFKMETWSPTVKDHPEYPHKK